MQPLEPNIGNDKVIEQLHASLRRTNDLPFEPEKLLLGKDEALTSFLFKQYRNFPREALFVSYLVH